jgi:hypothetical protein
MITDTDIHRDLGAFRDPQGLSTDSNECMLLIKEWIHSCEDHTICSRAASPYRGEAPQLPTRLLDVFHGPDKNAMAVVDSNKIGASSQYVTLSHCWGGNLSNKLLSSNEAAFRSCVPYDDLPRTFRDAVDLTRRLEVRYIWIDALCIIQDSEEDWARQAARMGDIYSDSYLNVCATTSTDGHGGLFRTRNPRAIAACRIDARWSAYRSGQFACYFPDAFMEKVELGPLNKRAWVVQERILSPRNVHFTEDQVFWECAQVKASECFVEGLPDESNILKSFMLPPGSGDTYDSKTLRILWDEMVKRYTGCALTMSSDKLVALAGIAQRFRHVAGYNHADYLAGLWRGNMEHELLWSTSLGGENRRPAQFRAPSWSWASVDSQVTGGFADAAMDPTRLYAKVVSASTAPRFDMYGSVAYGNVWMQGPMCELSTSATAASSEIPAFGREISFTTNGRLLDPLQVVLYADDLSEAGLLSITNEVVYFMIVRVVDRTSTTSYKKHEGLLLKPISSRKGVYNRLGLLVLLEKDAQNIVWDGFRSAEIPEERHQGLHRDEINYYNIELK